jgi:hypothetical protein
MPQMLLTTEQRFCDPSRNCYAERMSNKANVALQAVVYGQVMTWQREKRIS